MSKNQLRSPLQDHFYEILSVWSVYASKCLILYSPIYQILNCLGSSEFDPLKLLIHVSRDPLQGIVLLYCTYAGLSNVGKGDGSDLSMEVSMARSFKHFFDVSLHRSCEPHKRPKSHEPQQGDEDRGRPRRFDSSFYDQSCDCLSISLPCCPAIADDVRIKFFCSSQSVPKGYERCAFYFW